jgi:hypothetical protein
MPKCFAQRTTPVQLGGSYRVATPLPRHRHHGRKAPMFWVV